MRRVSPACECGNHAVSAERLHYGEEVLGKPGLDRPRGAVVGEEGFKFGASGPKLADYFSSAFFSSLGAGKSSVLSFSFQRRAPALCVPTASKEPSGEKATHQQVLV